MATTFHKVSNGISDRLHDVSGRFTDFKDDAVRDVGRRIDSLGALMKKHPLFTIGIGLATGYVLSRIIHRE